MPYIHATIAKKVNDDVKIKLQQELGTQITAIPEKHIGNTVITINDGLTMYNNGEPLDGAFFDIRLFKASPEDAKKAYAEKVFAIIEEVLDIPPNRVQINYTEMPVWAAGGHFMT